MKTGILINGAILINVVILIIILFIARISRVIGEFYTRRSIELYHKDEDERSRCIKKIYFYEHMTEELYKWAEAIAATLCICGIIYMK